MAENKGKIPQRWGLSEGAFWAELEGERVLLNLRSGEMVRGELTGVDTYAVFVTLDRGATVLVEKHAIETAMIDWIPAGKSFEGVNND